jgi:hypothetical protein
LERFARSSFSALVSFIRRGRVLRARAQLIHICRAKPLNALGGQQDGDSTVPEMPRGHGPRCRYAAPDRA